MKKRILGLDVGDVRIGVAVSDGLGLTAQPISTLVRQGTEKDLESIRRLLTEYETEEIVVGLPVNMDGSSGPQAQKTREFADLLVTRLAAKVTFWDERLTSAQANKALLEGGMRRERRKQVIDQIAAVLILQSYLDAHEQAKSDDPLSNEWTGSSDSQE